MKIIWWKNIDKNINNHNIFLWISLWNSFFNCENNIIKYIEFAKKYTKNRIVILIADEIQKYNYIRQKKCSIEKAEKKVQEEKNKKTKYLNEIIKNYFPNDNIHIIYRKDIIDENYNNDLKKILDEYNKKEIFFHNINTFVNKHIQKIWRTVNIKSTSNSALYILHEIPLLVKGFIYQWEKYSCYPYPTIWVWKILVDIQNGKYPDIKKILNWTLAIQCIIK